MIRCYIMRSKDINTKLWTDDIERSINCNIALARWGITFILTQE